MAGYTQVTQGAFIAALAERLQDTANAYWSQAELRLYLAEALRTWQAMTGWYRSRVTVTPQAGVSWYDIGSYTLTDQYLVSVLLYQLLEKQLNAGAWAGTEQFDLPEITTAMQSRLDRFLGDSGIVVSRYTLSVVPTATGRIPIQNNTIDVLRLAWGTTVLWRESEWSLNSFNYGWQTTPGTPQVYSVAASNPVTVQLAPPPSANGTLDIVAVRSGPTLTLAGVILGVPDDFAWGVKWGVLADLLSRDGEAKDPARAAYCEQRYQECIELATLYPSIVQTIVNGTVIFTGSVFDLDAFDNGWQTRTSATPTEAGLAGRNLLALAPAPTGSENILLDVVATMPLPVSDSDYLQVPPDVMPAIYAYAHHLAAFKMGGDEFAATNDLRAVFMTEAGKYNERLRVTNFYNDAIRNLSSEQTNEVQRVGAADNG